MFNILKSILAVFVLLSFIVTGYDHICPAYTVCTVDANSSTVVIAGNNVPEVVVNCISDNACKKKNLEPGLVVYSSANNTYINCLGDDSCEETNLNFGIGPNGETGFNGVRDKVVVSCHGKQSCKLININNIGSLISGLMIDTPADVIDGPLINTGAFMDGLAECGIASECMLECGSNMDTCKNAKCYGNCECFGTACPVNYNQPPTFNPSSNPSPKPTTPAPVVPAPGSPINTPAVQLPTPEPTPSPTDHRNTTACEVNGCVLVPGNNYDVECGSQYSTCTIDCSDEAQCSEAVKIKANSANVLIICGSISSCDSVEIFVEAESVVTIQVSEEKAGTNMVISVTNENAVVNIDVTGKEGIDGTKLYCDGNCNLSCTGGDSCKDVLYECLTTQDKCLLTCDSSENQCPIIEKYGDAACTTTPNNCVIVPDSDNKRIVILNNVNTVTIICNEYDQQCKGFGLQIYSGAKNTNMLCNAQDTCEDAGAYVGELKGINVPKGFKESQFAGNFSRIFNANCNYNSACKGLILYTEGPVSSTLDGNGEDSLQESNSICNNCNSLLYLCKEFDGCRNAIISCTNPLACSCVNEYEVDIGNATEALLVSTEAPRDSCPPINNYVKRQKISNINNANSVVYNNNNNNIHKTLSIVIPTLVVIAVILIIFGYIMVNYRKFYTKIDGITSKTDKFMLSNENVYATYQVEMQ